MSNKSNRGMRKRFKKTATGKLRFFSPGGRHLLSCKSAKRKRNLRKAKIMADCEVRAIERQFGVIE